MTSVQHGHIASLLAAIQSEAPIEQPACVVIAHPDDEVIGMGGCLATFRRLTLIQLTDGSPRCAADRRRAGFANRSDYAAAREREACRALATLGVIPDYGSTDSFRHPEVRARFFAREPRRMAAVALRGSAFGRTPQGDGSKFSQAGVSSLRRVCYRIPDQEAVLKLVEITRALERELGGMQIVFTHPYEGGHPDHDAAAFAVQTACQTMSRFGRAAPARIEFASYHCRDGRLSAGRFWPDATCSELSILLPEQAVGRKREALACHISQRAVTAWFDPGLERYRLAPRYDFTRPPPPGSALYDAFGWTMTSARWRRLARVAMEELSAS